MRLVEWGSLAGTRTTEQEFYWLWILATTAYGVGDIVTTIALVEFTTHLVEANPFVSYAIGTYGLPGLVGLKLAAFFACLGLSVVAIRSWDDRSLYAFPPLVLTIVGLLTTVLNIRLMLG